MNTVAAFKRDNVLQENIIIRAVKDSKPHSAMRISQSGGGAGNAVRSRIVRTTEIISTTDPEVFIHIPTNQTDHAVRDQIFRLEGTLDSLGLTVSTGKVVDFRVREHLRQQAETGTCPLIYPCHFKGYGPT